MGAGNPSPLKFLLSRNRHGAEGEGMVKRPRTLRLGSLNVRGCGVEGRMEEIGSMFERRRMDVLALSETKLKGKGEVMFGGVRGRKSGVNERVRAREGVCLLVREELERFVKEWKEVSSRLMWVRMSLGCERWVFVSAYGPYREEERDDLWEELRVC